MISEHLSSSIEARGKFFVKHARKFFFKAIRLDDPNSTASFEDKLRIRARLDELKASSTTGLILKGAQAEIILDLAAQVGLCAMLEIDVDPNELLYRAGFATISAQLARTATALGNHPALLGYLLNCPVGADWIKMQGAARIQRKLSKLIQALKARDQNHMVAIHHSSGTRAISCLDEDLIYCSPPPLTSVELKDFVVSLHNLAEARPVVIEFDNATPEQDERIACAFAVGAAGVVAPPLNVAPRPELLSLKTFSSNELLPFVTLNGTCPPVLRKAPMVSVVICAYNAERTMRPCLESLRALEYPNFEVVIVDDGSRDRTAEIAKDFPEFRLIRQPNKGLSVARNVGMHAARGEIIAYTDSDCVVDPHWLTLMVGAMVEKNFDACGGPNYAPLEEGRVEACVAVSPGAPCHVLTGEDRAEHLAGCNMVFRKSLLLKLDGFDAQFTAAGDDVDICWRALDAGYVIGFCPAAFVWHFRRNTIKAYFGQQRGYGKAEAMLYLKYPERFNVLGQVMWRGTIPGLARTLPGGSRKRIFWGPRARGFFQSVYEAEQGIVKFLPQTLEWQLFCALVLAASFAVGLTLLPGLAMLAMGPVWAMYYATQAPIQKSHDRLSSRCLVALLSYVGPIARALTRYRLRLLGAWSAKNEMEQAPRQRPSIDLISRGLRLNYWNEKQVTRDGLLDRLSHLLVNAGHPVVQDSGWNDFDLEVRPDAWTRVEIKTADEEHGSGRLKNLVLARVRLTPLTYIPVLALVSGAVASSLMGLSSPAVVLAGLGFVAAAFAIAEGFESAQLVYRVIEGCAAELDLIPLGTPTAAAREQAATAQATSPANAKKDMAPVESMSEDRPLVD